MGEGGEGGCVHVSMRNVFPNVATVQIILVYTCRLYVQYNASTCILIIFIAENQSDYPYGALRLCPDMSVDCQDKRQLEVFKFDRWEHVCFTGFDDEVALVACRELGYVNVTSVKKV